MRRPDHGGLRLLILPSLKIVMFLKPQSTHPDHAVHERLQALWLRWTDHAAPDGLADFYGLQAMAVRAMVESGESFARLKLLTCCSHVLGETRRVHER